ncbi:MAG: S8 family serine peptidase [Bacteroidia bacterium]|nr:S8 family serine peptidase [Bacteroidia bacterium]
MRFFLLALLTLFLPFFLFGQAFKPPHNWHLNDVTDSVSGTNVNKVYRELINKQPAEKKIIVAVIDGGTDYNHEDLKPVIWSNPNEKPNGIDDDGNGYIDDLNGWNYLGSKKGDQQYDQLEFTRIVSKYEPIIATRLASTVGKDSLELYNRAVKEYKEELKTKEDNLKNYENLLNGLNTIKSSIAKDTILLSDITSIKSPDNNTESAIKLLTRNMANGMYFTATKARINQAIKASKTSLDYHLNTHYTGREMVGDDYNNPKERVYGNNHTDGPDAKHGTAVAGCIAAVRGNNVGMEGITNDVEILIVRAVPDGDERDKDVANAIRYAVDKGASVINMSFGKAYTTNKQEVDEAIRYAESKDVLLVHAAGNNGAFIDKEIHYPSNFYGDNKKIIHNMITVGASDYKKNPTVFSNYGPKSVDVFAPGKDIYTTFPGSTYGYINGTSFSCPITAGVAALIRTYYPALTASQVKDILIKSAYKIKYKVPQPGNTGKTVKYKTLCKSGGVIDAYEAMKLAEKTFKKHPTLGRNMKK